MKENRIDVARDVCLKIHKSPDRFVETQAGHGIDRIGKSGDVRWELWRGFLRLRAVPPL